MLERGGVEDDFGLMTLEHVVKRRAVADRAKLRAADDLGKLVPHLHLDRVEIEFAMVEQHDFGRAERGDLAHQLAADRAPCPSHQYPAPPDQPVDDIALERHFGTAEQVGKLELLDLDARFAIFCFLQVVGMGDGEVALIGQLHQMGEGAARHRLVAPDDKAFRLEAPRRQRLHDLGQLIG